MNIPIGQGTIQANFNPFQVATFTATIGTDMLYLPLEAYNGLTDSYIPYLATGHEIVSASQVDFTLRSGVKWSNGKPVTTADIIYTYGLLKKNPALDTTGASQLVQSVTAQGNTIIFKLKSPDSQIAPDLAQIPIVPQSVWSAVPNPVTYTNADPTVVDGPYETQTISPVKLVFQKNPKYFDIAQMTEAPDTVTGTPGGSGASSILDMEKGIFDWMELGDPDRGGFATDWVAKDPANNHYWIAGSGLVSLYLNQAKAPFNDLKFRQALSYGINRQAISQHANVNGYEAPATQTGLSTVDSKLIPSSVPNGGNVTYDLAKAKQLLLSGGYHYAGGKLIGKNGQPVSFTLQTIQGFTDNLAAGEEISTELAQLGISVQVTQVQFGAAVANIFSGEYDTAMYFSNLGNTPYSSYQALLANYMTAPVGHPAYGDYERLNDPQVDGLLAEIASSTNVSTQNAAIGSLASYVYNNVPVLELTVSPGWYEYTTKHYTGWPTLANPYADPPSDFGQLEVIPHLKAVG